MRDEEVTAEADRPAPGVSAPAPDADADRWIAPEEFFRNIRQAVSNVHTGCNLRCKYCLETAGREDAPRMSVQTFKRVADLVLRNSRFSRVALDLQGGEPLLLPDEWFLEALGYAADLAKQCGKRVDHPLQTNATLLTPRRIETLQKLGVMLGISLDGPPELNDSVRGGGAEVVEAIRCLIERRMRFSTICVLSHSNYRRMHEVMDFFRSLRIPGIFVKFIMPQGRPGREDLLSGQEMFEGMKAVFEYMAKTDCAVLDAGVHRYVVRFFTGRQPRPQYCCWEHQCQAGRTFCTVNHLGEVLGCGGIRNPSHNLLGHIDKGFSARHLKQTLAALHHKDAWYVRCFGCNAYRICSQSCTNADRSDLGYRDQECELTRLYYGFLSGNLAKARAVYDTILRRFPDSVQALQ